jgi:hypothetical protein
MCIGDALRELAGFLDGCEGEGHVTGVGLVERHDRGGSREVSAEVELSVSPSGTGEVGLGLREASLDGDGRLGLAFESLDPVVPAPDGRVEVEPTHAALGPDGTVTVTLTATVPAGEGTGAGTDGAGTDTPTTDGGPTAGERGRVEEERKGAGGPPATDRERDVPPFRDPDLLAEVYESCDTFAEMTDAIGMDVTAETVRRYMIDYGIHQPNSYDTGGGAEDPDAADAEGDAEPRTPDADEDGSPVVLADGIGLPDDVTVETLIETVKASNTLYEVERDIGVEREDALDMLRELNLLDLVVGRLSTQDRREIGREDVVERLREASATASGSPG